MTDDPKDPPLTDDDGWGEAAEIDRPEPAPAIESKPAPAIESKPAPAIESKPAPEVESKPAPEVESKPAPAPKKRPPISDPEPYIPPSPSPDLRSAAFDDDEPPKKRGLFSRGGKKSRDRETRHRVSPSVVSGTRTLWVIGIAAGLLLFGVGAVLSWLNTSGFYFVCQPTQIVAERGRWLPWGHSKLGGRAWEPVDKPEDVRCKDRRFDKEHELRAAFAAALKARASHALAQATQKKISGEALELADKQLHQALLLLRDAENDDERKELERLEGDVEYWRAAASVSSAIDQLVEAGKRFDEAASRGPRHAGDSATWADYSRDLSEQLRKGPPELRPEVPAPPGTAPPFSGTGNGTPVSPDQPDEPDAGTTAAAPVDTTDAGPPPPDAAPPPLPTGGVLL